MTLAQFGDHAGVAVVPRPEPIVADHLTAGRPQLRPHPSRWCTADSRVPGDRWPSGGDQCLRRQRVTAITEVLNAP